MEKTLIEKAIKFIQNGSKENLSLQEIADKAGFSLTYFDALFKKHTGYSPVEYSRVYKLTRSALELRRTDKKIIDIALDFGYESPEAYARAFKKFYSLSPSEYREKYSNDAITWKDLSSRVAINRFANANPTLKRVDKEIALDFIFTNNPVLFAEDAVNITVGDCEIFTLGESDTLEHFMCVSDYNSERIVIDLICINESDAIAYLKLLAKTESYNFTMRKNTYEEWDNFNIEVAKLGLVCRYGYDMVYTDEQITAPSYNGITVRELAKEDMPYIQSFKSKGGCGENHLRGLQIAFEGKGNVGEKAYGAFVNNELVCLATPVLDKVRELNKYDIGAIFSITNDEKAIEAIWKYTIKECIKNGAILGNANAKEDTSYVSVAQSEKMGLTKVAEVRRYSK
ncbi:MAG: helix-turn-helix transcriptional regulator [Clostridia bacterium]|nr:helix-turn-helix transcriptional regulator [Clostridia bacterium]